MGRSLQIVLIIADALITLIILIPIFLWFLLKIYFANYKIGKNRKKMVKMLRKEGLSERASIKIAEHMFPKMEFSLWGIMSFLHGGGKEIKPVGKQDR